MVVPTVDRGLRMLFFWRIAIAGQMPSIRIDVRLLHPLEELPRIGRQRLDVAPLPLGVDRVEGERRLARPADAGHDDQRRGGQGEVDVLEVVCARAADDDLAASGLARGSASLSGSAVATRRTAS